MPTLSFEGETHGEIVQKVRRWLRSVDEPEAAASPVDALAEASSLTREAVAIVARSAPGAVPVTDVVKALARRGYDAGDSTRRAVVAALDELADDEGTGLVKRVRRARNAVAYEMSTGAAKQVLRSLKA